MKTNQTIIAATVASLLAAPAIADKSKAEVYGKVNLTLQSSDGDLELKSNASRFGLKGSDKLAGGITVFYKYEIQIDPADESKEKNLKSRNQYLGLKGGFGELIIGRNDSMLKQSQGKIDVFSDLKADIKTLWKGENRLDNSISYKTPKINNLQFGLTYYIDEEADEQATSMSLVYGDKALKRGKYYAGLGLDNEVKGYDIVRLTGGAKIQGVKLGFMYQTQEKVETGKELSGVMVNGQYKVGAYNLKTQFQTLEDDSGFSLGVDRKLGKNTKAFAFITNFNFEMETESTNKKYLGLGLEHKF